MDDEHGPETMDYERISVMLCEDMKVFRDDFFETQQNHFKHIEWCQDIHLLIPRLRALNRSGNLPDLLLLDLFSRKAGVPDDGKFREARDEIDRDVKGICNLLIETGEKARQILAPQGVKYLNDIRSEFPEYRLPILLYSRLGPYLLEPEEAATVDRCNAEFLLKWLDPDEQCRRIYRFHEKWRSREHPIALEISRKLSTLPPPLADAVAAHLKAGKFKAAVTDGCDAVTKLLQKVCRSPGDGGRLAQDARLFLMQGGRRRRGEEDWEFKSRVSAVCNLYGGAYVLCRSEVLHNTYIPEEWSRADEALSIYGLIWSNVQELIG